MPQAKERRVEYDAERKAAGEERRKEDIRWCWRCDVRWNAGFQYTSAAPCRDCREFLRNVDGDTTIYRLDVLRRLAAERANA
ncbi:hypothetical protein E3O55_08350 [Cryobacterium sp. MDB1-18-2]|uniref:hypothetical protein n=1 Tax=unclassified Cryobacterium TaxID=2649013 RepID=UPI00106A8EC4|nr:MULTISPECIES: hypothetical protein [unclassified Cryobacterium]TFC30087.1 hypothetical protein E3O55_08350 [Cryobacterium sp. MDB1-18-2]TFC41367.1 hypothetical protein E3O50_09790 [Cryobacterium sp. MDB1-18-1]